MYDSKLEKLESLQIDDFIWYIYIFIVFAALYSNKLEKEFTITKDRHNLTEFHSINLVVLTIAFFIYIYFVIDNFKKYSKQKSNITLISVIASILFLVAGGILLYVELITTDDDLNEFGI